MTSGVPDTGRCAAPESVQNEGSTTFPSGIADLLQCLTRVNEIFGGPQSHLLNSAETAEKPPGTTDLAEPFPGTVAKGLALVFMREMKG